PNRETIMRRHALLLCVIVAGGALLANAEPAGATSFATWVAGTGADVGACTVAAPCRTFAYALTQTKSGGTISVLSPGDFGPVHISKAVSIIADGVEAGIFTGSGSDGAAITVEAGSNDSVVLRGLAIDMHRNGNAGIRFLKGKALHV